MIIHLDGAPVEVADYRLTPTNDGYTVLTAYCDGVTLTAEGIMRAQWNALGMSRHDFEVRPGTTVIKRKHKRKRARRRA